MMMMMPLLILLGFGRMGMMATMMTTMMKPIAMRRDERLSFSSSFFRRIVAVAVAVAVAALEY